MVPVEILTKAYMNEEECDQLYNSQFEPMEFPWLEEVREWVNKTYNTRLLTIALSSGSRKGWRKRFLFFFYDQNDKIPRYVAGGGFHEDMRDIDHKIAEVSGLEEGSFDSFISKNFVSQWKRYLTIVKKQHDLTDKIKTYFKNVDLFCLLFHCEVCVMETKVKAGEFLLSEEYKIIKKKIYDLLKSYDKYDLLEEKDVTFFVDYKESTERPMYGRWLDDLMENQIIEYENGLINAYYESKKENTNG